ncbi:MAG: penicillin-binding protein 2 [Fidelibacterota bacterium]
MLKTELSIPKSRLYVAYGVVVFILLMLLVRFFILQVYHHEIYARKSDVNRIRAEAITAPRGLIRDRYGSILVDNYPTFILNVIPGEMTDYDNQIGKIGKILNINRTVLDRNYKKYYRSRFTPVRIAKDLTIEQLSRLEEHRLELSGIHYNQFPERIFPSSIRGSHFLGYVKEIDKEIYQTLKNPDHYELGDLIGWQGIEQVYNDELSGRRGVRYLEVNAYGQVTGVAKGRAGQHPQPGDDVYLTIDAGLQTMLEKEMTGKKGVAIVSDALTGGILAYVSVPDYPPDLFTGTTPVDVWNDLITNTDRPLLDRNTSGLYPPGSTFKMLSIIALAENGKLDRNFVTTCTGIYPYGDRDFRCWKEEGHGKVDLTRALAESCNIYFYQIIQALDIDEWAEICRQFGFGDEVGIDLPREQRGMAPDRVYMNRRYGRFGWSKGVMLNLAIGQGDIMVTPLQLIQYTNLLATHGHTYRPHLKLGLLVPLNNTPQIRETTWRLIDRLIQSVVYADHGTGGKANPHIPGLIIAGKTGTAENPHGEDHAWFIGYGKKDDRIISTTILIEHGGHGSSSAAPIARDVFQYIFGPTTLASVRHE